MSSLENYFPNHQRADRFPWSIYHKPLQRHLVASLRASTKPGQEILVVGAGYCQELSELRGLGLKVHFLDVDPRVLDLQRKLDTSGMNAGYYLVDENLNGYPERQFDFIYAKEVIEHIKDHKPFLDKLRACLRPGGVLWLSTPNYGFFLLPLLESTILELIARCTGFSRKDIHPNRFDVTKMRDALKCAGFESISISETDYKLAIIGSACRGKGDV